MAAIETVRHKNEMKFSSLPPVPAFYHEQPRASFFSHIMADRFNKVGNGCGIIILKYGVFGEL